MNLFCLLLMINIQIIKCFEEISFEISFAEEQLNGTLVIDLQKSISSLSLLNNSEDYQIKFVRPCSNLYLNKENRFEILSLRIDREEICPYEINCLLICYLFLENDKIRLIKLEINIKDINDHKPKFNKNFYSYELSTENIYKNNFHLQIEQAEDKDRSLENSIDYYYLNNSNIDFPFQLNFNKENHLLELILIKKIKEKKYLIELIVVDGKNEIDQCLIELIIIENHFSSPKFDLNLYQFNISNSNQILIGQVHAKNHFLNKQNIYYRLISSNYLNLFLINQTTGLIQLKNIKDIQKNFYEIFVEAFDQNYISSLTTVHIFFNFTSYSSLTHHQQEEEEEEEEENLIEVLIPKSFQKNLNEISLKENSSVPSTILQLFISSPSSSSSSSTLTMTTSISQQYFHLKQLDKQSFELLLLISFDYELIQQIYLNFTLQTSSNHFIQKSFIIFIENINDCLPHFLQNHFYLTIEENNPIPFHLYTFQAFDQDQLNDLSYQLEDIDTQIFSLNKTNGQFFILTSLDRELQSNYSFQICVFDQIFRKCSTVKLNILDQNDNICQFNSSIININLNENLLSNIDLIQLQAFDPDFYQNSTLFYSFTSFTSYLKINSSTGLIQTTTNFFDYEIIQFYSILIQSCDNIYSIPSFCCSIQLNININDQDDHLPYLIYPSNIHQIFLIDYNNRTMPQLKAFDKDLTPSHRLIFFSIIGGTLNSSISIDHYSGQLHLLSTHLPLFGTIDLSISSRNLIHLTILIYDNQTNPQTFLSSIQQSSFFFSSHFFFYLLSFPFLLLFLFATSFLLCYCYKHNDNHQDDRLMNTPSTTTLSPQSISTSNNRKLCETYYSFGDSFLSQQVIHL